MKKTTLVLVALMSAALASESALAHGGRGRIQFGLHFGVPIYGPPFYHPSWPYYYSYHPYHPYFPPPVQYVVPPQQPQIWIERDSFAPASPVPGFWYFCAESRAYYPSVGECPGGWQRVSPQPPPG